MPDNDEQQLPLFDLELSPSERQPAAASIADHRDAAPSTESRYSKYIVFVDESGDHGMQTIDPNYPLFVLALCVFHKRHYSEKVVSALEKFKFNHFGHDQVVLHENEIRKEKGEFNIFRSREEKFAFMDELTQIIERSNFILISCVIDKRQLKGNIDTNANPYHIALGFCLETLFEFLQEKGQEEKQTHVVVECRGRKEDNELELEFRRICDGANRLSQQLPFDVRFSDKKAMSSGLQLADLVARPIGLSVFKPAQENRAFDVLKRKFYCAGGRDAVGNDFEGYGLKIFPSPESEKPR
ncbi:DUF3800 domain-containing protein [Zhongshania marina]|uniref:DUF3800 domain-containing protein n=1 Tax=Zhongshania marina TaxID=2304603 RepID=A0A2S4HKQ1_9GAMM|nr:DUF3800 domain-containing protein [Marortus luteolus]POP54261.1 DUF3800 domain-containing protein [Marortus luteolus]